MILGLSGADGAARVYGAIVDLQPAKWQWREFDEVVYTTAAALLRTSSYLLKRDEFKNNLLPEEWRTYHVPGEFGIETVQNTDTGRDFLRKVREGLLTVHPDAILLSLMYQYKKFPKEVKERWAGHAINIGSDAMVLPDWVIADVTAPNQYQVIHHVGGKVIHILNDEMESPLDPAGVQFDYYIDNNHASQQDILDQVQIILADL